MFGQRGDPAIELRRWLRLFDASRLRMSWRAGTELAVTCISMGARNPDPHRFREFEKLIRPSLRDLPSPNDWPWGDASPWSPSPIRLCHRCRAFHPQWHGFSPAAPDPVLCAGPHNHSVGVLRCLHPMVFRIGFVSAHLRQKSRLLLKSAKAEVRRLELRPVTADYTPSGASGRQLDFKPFFQFAAQADLLLA